MASVLPLRTDSELPALKRKRTILVADDNQDTREILGIVFGRQLGDCELVIARDGEEALAIWNRVRPDLAILDIMMPKLDGLEVCRRIKQDAKSQYLPVLLLTALDRPDRIVAGLEAGADDYITKPFDPLEMSARVRAHLRIRAQQEELVATRAELTRMNAALDETVKAQVLEITRIHRLKRYLAPGVVDSVLANGADPTTAPPRRKTLSILFVDIRGFSRLAEQLEPEDVVEVLGEYLEEMSDDAFSNLGTINKVMGDGILVLFNDPLEQPDHAARALRTGIEMCNRAQKIEARLHTRLPEPFRIGVGVHTGTVTIGNIGKQRLLDFTAVGPAVNIASRVQQLATDNQVIATRETYEALGDGVTLTEERRETLKGLPHPIRIARVVAVR